MAGASSFKRRLPAGDGIECSYSRASAGPALLIGTRPGTAGQPTRSRPPLPASEPRPSELLILAATPRLVESFQAHSRQSAPESCSSPRISPPSGITQCTPINGQQVRLAKAAPAARCSIIASWLSHAWARAPAAALQAIMCRRWRPRWRCLRPVLQGPPHRHVRWPPSTLRRVPARSRRRIDQQR